MPTLVYTMALTMATLANDGSPATPFTQPVEGTTLSIDMRPMPGTDPPAWVSRDEISWDLYDALVYRLDVPADAGPTEGVTRPTKPYLMADRGWGHAGFPALSVSPRGAEAFCVWLTSKTGRVWRLPTVSEWTALCEASGITPDSLDAHAWHAGNAEKRTHAIGTRQADANGLHDLWGNVSEWCRAADGSQVLMGGCYLDGGPGCSMQKVPTPAWNDTDPQIPKSVWWLADAPFAGFRVVCEAPPGKTAEEETANDEPAK
ncbi:MAG: SUMF1/EgtB/PvdO family nonheme iron enzyme [Phycisphaerales bacterium]|nr:SUMF1/EgtB/PvdO family nonheme iron enzyme [Phycisphaerales bacterium]